MCSLEVVHGQSFEWMRLDEKKASRITFRKPFDGYDPDNWSEMIEWLTVHVERLEKAFAPHLPKIGKKMKAGTWAPEAE